MQYAASVRWRLNKKGLKMLERNGIYAVSTPNTDRDPSTCDPKTTPQGMPVDHNVPNLKPDDHAFASELYQSSAAVNSDRKTIPNEDLKAQTKGSEPQMITNDTPPVTAAPIINNNIDLTTAKGEETLDTAFTQHPAGSSDNKNIASEALTGEGHTGQRIGEDLPPIADWHLRKKKAELFIEDCGQVPYLAALKDFLKTKGISWERFDPKLHYLPYDLLITTKASYKNEGKCVFWDDGKSAVWEFLRTHFKDL